MPDLGSWPTWGAQLAWTLVTLAVSWGAGHVLGALVTSRVPRWLSDRQQVLAQSAVQIARKRLPWLSVLVGIWLSAGYWPLTAEGHLLVGRAVFVLGAASVTLALAAIASQSVDAYGAIIAPALPVSSLTRNIAWALIAVLGLLVILNGLGLSITPMLTALGVGGLAVALALQEPLANFFAGLFIALAGQIRVGDYVKLDSGQEGYVVDFSWRSTRLRMLANNLVVVPNAKLAQAILVNHHLPSQDLAVLVDVGVDYSSSRKSVTSEFAAVASPETTRVGCGSTSRMYSSARKQHARVPVGVEYFEHKLFYHVAGRPHECDGNRPPGCICGT
jgi:hypothetical protein